MGNIEYANAYNEVLEILKYISKSDYNKISPNMLGLFKTNSNKEHNFSYDIDKTLEEQNVSKKTKTIIAILFRDYWATDEQREKILAKEKYDMQRHEEELREKYNPDDIFKYKVEPEIEIIQEKEEMALVNIETIPFYKKIFYKIKHLFMGQKI